MSTITPFVSRKRDQHAQTITRLVTKIHQLDIRIGELSSAIVELRFLRRERQSLQHQLDVLIEQPKER